MADDNQSWLKARVDEILNQRPAVGMAVGLVGPGDARVFHAQGCAHLPTRRAVTADGRMEIVLADPGDGRTAVITTPYGTFRGPDYAIDISAMFPSTRS